METYLRFNHASFPTKADKVIFTASYLRGSAFNWFYPYNIEYIGKGGVDLILETSNTFLSYKNFKKILIQTFGAVNKV